MKRGRTKSPGSTKNSKKKKGKGGRNLNLRELIGCEFQCLTLDSLVCGVWWGGERVERERGGLWLCTTLHVVPPIQWVVRIRKKRISAVYLSAAESRQGERGTQLLCLWERERGWGNGEKRQLLVTGSGGKGDDFRALQKQEENRG